VPWASAGSQLAVVTVVTIWQFHGRKPHESPSDDGGTG